MCNNVVIFFSNDTKYSLKRKLIGEIHFVIARSCPSNKIPGKEANAIT